MTPYEKTNLPELDIQDLSDSFSRPLPKEITAQMRHILEGIRRGIYNHLQTNWHCGSAHCFFGWKVFLDNTDKMFNLIHERPEVKELAHDSDVKGYKHNLDVIGGVADMRTLNLPAYLWNRLLNILLAARPKSHFDHLTYTAVKADWRLTQFEARWLSDETRTWNELMDGVEYLEKGNRINYSNQFEFEKYIRDCKNKTVWDGGSL